MLEAFAAAAGFGLLIGLRYSVPAVVAVSAAIAITGTAVGQFADWSMWAALAAAGGAVIALQCGYLAGLLLVGGASRAKSWPRLVRHRTDSR